MVADPNSKENLRRRYNVVRKYVNGEPSRIIRREVCLADALAHCKHPATQVEGVYFDTYIEIK
jgi:hypothetical protein